MAEEVNLWQVIEEQDQKFGYAFATLCFAILGLSIQFSPNYGKIWAPLLVAAWSLLLTSALIAGYRIVYRVVAMKINYQMNKGENYITHAKQILNVKKVNPYQKVIRPDGSDLPIPELQGGLADAEKLVAEGAASFKKLDSRLSTLYWVQIGAFLCGLICNFVFVSVNYLFGAG